MGQGWTVMGKKNAHTKSQRRELRGYGDKMGRESLLFMEEPCRDALPYA